MVKSSDTQLQIRANVATCLFYQQDNFKGHMSEKESEIKRWFTYNYACNLFLSLQFLTSGWSLRADEKVKGFINSLKGVSSRDWKSAGEFLDLLLQKHMKRRLIIL